MINYLITIIICSCAILQINGQSKTFHLGLKAEAYTYSYNRVTDKSTYSKELIVSPLPSFYVIISKDLSDAISFNIKPGILFRPESLEGFELGASVNEKIYDSKFFLTEGANLHFSKESSHGTGIVEVTDSKIIFFILLGAGYQLTNRIAFDIIFHQAIDGKYGYSYVSPDPDNISGPQKIINMVKFGLSFIY